jgi:glycosyltransferase involved in cell wall biosynthesis
MRVCFDSQIFCSQEFGGISRYFSSLAKALVAVPGIQPKILAPLSINGYLDDLPQGLVRGFRMQYLSRGALPIRAASVLSAALLEHAMRPDIVHRTYYYPVPRAPRSSRTVLTVYDMIHEKYPQSYSAKDRIAEWKRQAVASADHIICISRRTRDDLLTLLNTPEEKVSVTHLGFDALDGFDDHESSSDFSRRVLGADIPYLLYVGSRTQYKNFSRLLAAYAGSPKLSQSYRLLCFGGGAFSEGERAMIAHYGATNEVRQYGGSDAVLAACYRHATLFVYPSLYEGFGIPPLEAMSLGCPVACSNSSSLPEVVGDAAVTFDPADPQAIRVALESVLDSASERARLIEQGRRRCSFFSWRRCAEETADIYKRVLNA